MKNKNKEVKEMEEIEQELGSLIEITLQLEDEVNKLVLNA
jgi:hypothetical protein